MSSERFSGRRIVVGVDGSPSSRAALAWAVRQAELTSAAVEAVIAWNDVVSFTGAALSPTGVPANSNFGEHAAAVLSHSINETVDPDGLVKVSSTVRRGNPAQVLLGESVGADLLVVGSRGHGGFTGALLGSVSQACVHHAQCPVVIIRGPKAG
jgi:nucleotide-binding universal stress UspA family protein